MRARRRKRSPPNPNNPSGQRGDTCARFGRYLALVVRQLESPISACLTRASCDKSLSAFNLAPRCCSPERVFSKEVKSSKWSALSGSSQRRRSQLKMSQEESGNHVLSELLLLKPLRTFRSRAGYRVTLRVICVCVCGSWLVVLACRIYMLLLSAPLPTSERLQIPASSFWGFLVHRKWRTSYTSWREDAGS